MNYIIDVDKISNNDLIRDFIIQNGIVVDESQSNLKVKDFIKNDNFIVNKNIHSLGFYNSDIRYLACYLHKNNIINLYNYVVPNTPYTSFTKSNIEELVNGDYDSYLFNTLKNNYNDDERRKNIKILIDNFQNYKQSFEDKFRDEFRDYHYRRSLSS